MLLPLWADVVARAFDKVRLSGNGFTSLRVPSVLRLANSPAQLRFDHFRQPEGPALRREIGEALVLHLAEGIHRLAAEQRLATEIGLSRGGEHLAHEDRFELLRCRSQLFALRPRVGAAIGLAEMAVGEEGKVLISPPSPP